MKPCHIYNLLYSIIALLAVASCSKEEPTLSAASDSERLIVLSITDGGYASSGNVSTRTAENGYTTRFTAGDACGLYIVRGTQNIYSNVKLTAERDATTGGLAWIPEEGTTLAGGMPNECYYLYYPYQTDMDGKTVAPTGKAPTDATFFAPLISNWQTQEDQSSRASYTASDLMTAQGTASVGADNTLQLSFSMTHRMALAIIDMPQTVYEFTNPRVPDYTVLAPTTFSGSAQPLQTANEYRYITNPNATSSPTLEGSYNSESKVFAIPLSGLAAGSYKKYKVDGAARTRKSYTIQRGDFLLTDGHLLPKETTLTEEQKANVAAIIFWTPAETDPTGRQTPASLTDDKIMARDFPQCNHGLAFSVNYMYPLRWQNCDNFTEDDFIANFQSGNGFARADKSDFVPIAPLNNATDDLNRILGYQNTQVLLAYNAWCRAANRGTAVGVADGFETFAKSHPAPHASTGWYVPSIKELHMLCYKDIDDIYYSSWNLRLRETVDIVLDSYQKVRKGDDPFAIMISAWSSTECKTLWTDSSKYSQVYHWDVQNNYIRNTRKNNFYNGASCAMYVVCAF